MPNNYEELKSFILWMKEQKVHAFSVEGVSVTFFPEAPKPLDLTALGDAAKSEQTPEEAKKAQDEILFYSAG